MPTTKMHEITEWNERQKGIEVSDGLGNVRQSSLNIPL
jgi:hypothetical protein